MDSNILFVILSILLVFVSLVGAYLPHIKKMDDKQVHLLVSLGAGIFVGLLFLLLLPEALEEGEHIGKDMHEIMFYLIGGFLLIMIVETIIKTIHADDCACGEDHHSHKITFISSFFGLSVHAICDGIALAATFLAGEEIGLIATAGMCIHKIVVLFSLSSTMLLTDMEKKESMKYLVGFSLITPIFGLLFYLVFSNINIETITALALCFASGTFMYVALCDILPEAFHREGQIRKSFFLIVLGIALIAIISFVFPHGH